MKETDHAPENWARCSLADIVVLNPKNDANAEQTAGFVPMALAPTDYHGALQHEEKLWGEIKKSYTNFADGDVIFAKVTPCFENGKAAIVRDMPSGIGAGSSEFYVLRPASKEISPNLLFAIIKTQSFMQQGAENMTGAVGLRRVPRAFVESFPVALPPAAEQKVIADKLDTLLSQVENTKARLERIPQILKRFRQSVLAAAVSGRLTEEWRNASGLSDQYEVKSLAELGEILTGNTPSKKRSEFYGGQFPMFKPGDLDSGYQLRDGSDYLTDQGKCVSRLIPPRSTLVTCIGATIGKTGFSRVEGTCNQQINAIIPSDAAVPEWLYFLMISPQMQEAINRNASSTTLPILNKSRFSKLLASVPTLQEQTEIVRRVDQLFAHADRIEQQVNNALARVNNLTQSILAKAFRGELTEQWRKDNPELISGENSAEALLERIRAERAVATKPKRRTSKT